MAEAPNAPAAVPRSGPIARVKINVGAPDAVKNQIVQYLSQDLQALGNVQLVEQMPRWTIEIVTTALQDGEGRIQAIGMSFVVLEHGPQMQMLVTMAQAWRYVMAAGFLQDKFVEQGMRQLVSRVDSLAKSSDLTVLSEHKMCVIPLAKVEDACRDIVTSFDTKFLRSANPSEASVAYDPAEQPTLARR